MTVRLHAPRIQSYAHLPPPEVINLRLNYFNRAVDSDIISVPLDEFGVPRPLELMKSVLGTVDDSYKWPSPTNVHHVAFTRAMYYNYPDDPEFIAARYRETHSLMLCMPVQLHNYAHAVMDIPPLPAYDVMRQRVVEQNQVSRLARFGERAIRYTQWSESDEKLAATAQTNHHNKVLMNKSRMHGAMANISMRDFYEYLEQVQDGQVGLMPERDVLARVDFSAAVRYLGVLSAVRSVNLQPTSESLLLTA